MPDTIDYYFSIGSPYAYIGLGPLRKMAAQNGKTIRPLPVTILVENGAVPLRTRAEPRRRYWHRDLKRWSLFRGHSLYLDNRPQLSEATPAALSVIATDLDGGDWIGLATALHEAHWGRAEDIGQPAVREAIANAAGFDGAHLLRREADADVQARWQANLDSAKAAGVFGSPSYIYDGELYWGQDNLPFLELHLAGKPVVPR